MKNINNTINKTKYLEFKSAKSPSGSDWYYIKRTNDSNSHDSAVAITTLVKKDGKYNFLFIKTKRPPIYSENKAKFCLESPAGLIADENKNESLIECAKKELKEETGYLSDKFYIELMNSSTSSGLTSETLSYITAFIENPVKINEPLTDGGIITEWIYVEYDRVLEYIKSINQKEISVSSALITGVYFALERLKTILH